MTDSAITRYRLYNQRVSHTQFTDPGRVVHWLGAIQAQDYAGAKWSIGLRMQGGTDTLVEQAIAGRTILRTWALRGTLHFVAPEDIRWMLALVRPRFSATSATYYRKLELDKKVIARSQKIMTQALQGGKQLTRPELRDTLERKGVATDSERVNFLLVRAAIDGLLCLGARRGKEFTYTLLDEWIPAAGTKPREEALAALAARYFRSHGPATLRDFAWWSGLSTAEATTALDLAGPGLVHETVKGHSYWMPRNMPDRKNSSVAYLLPGFDELLIGYTDRSAMLAPAHAGKIMGTGNGILSPFIVTQGRVSGTWKRIVKKNEVTVHTASFAPESAARQKAIRAGARRYSRFMEMSLAG